MTRILPWGRHRTQAIRRPRRREKIKRKEKGANHRTLCVRMFYGQSQTNRGTTVHTCTPTPRCSNAAPPIHRIHHPSHTMTSQAHTHTQRRRRWPTDCARTGRTPSLRFSHPLAIFGGDGRPPSVVYLGPAIRSLAPTLLLLLLMLR